MAKEPKASSKEGTTVMRCTCTHRYQDRIYGAQMRLHNRSQKDGGATCTVCGTEKR